MPTATDRATRWTDNVSLVAPDSLEQCVVEFLVDRVDDFEWPHEYVRTVEPVKAWGSFHNASDTCPWDIAATKGALVRHLEEKPYCTCDRIEPIELQFAGENFRTIVVDIFLDEFVPVHPLDVPRFERMSERCRDVGENELEGYLALNDALFEAYDFNEAQMEQFDRIRSDVDRANANEECRRISSGHIYRPRADWKIVTEWSEPLNPTTHSIQVFDDIGHAHTIGPQWAFRVVRVDEAELTRARRAWEAAAR